MTRPFRSELILEERISEATLRAYHVGFDQNAFRLQPLVDLIVEVIPEYALGLHEGADIPLAAIVSKLREAALTVYQTDRYERRGEFGELILHLLLREFCNTIPLVAAIYFQDSVNHHVKGFDGVHGTLTEGTRKLWLGESKIYTHGEDGIAELVEDLVKHYCADYLRQQFVLLKRKLPSALEGVEEWRALMDEHRTLDAVFDSLVIPMACTYSSRACSDHVSETSEYLAAFEEECRGLHRAFRERDIKTDLDVILLLLPVPDKKELVAELDGRLKAMQQL